MNNTNDPYLKISTTGSSTIAQFMTRVYSWMSIGIFLTAAVSYFISSDEALVTSIMTNPVLFYGCIIAQVAVVLSMSFLIQRINAVTATLLYLAYAALTGVTFSILFLIYTKDSMASIFALTAFSFSGLTAVGFFTKRDLGPVGSFCTMGLFGMIGWGLLSLFFPSMMSGTYSTVYSIVGVIVFAGLTAYDTQKIKQIGAASTYGSDSNKKAAIFGALTLYLDFINLFISLLRLMGKRR